MVFACNSCRLGPQSLIEACTALMILHLILEVVAFFLLCQAKRSLLGMARVRRLSSSVPADSMVTNSDSRSSTTVVSDRVGAATR